MPSGVYDIEHAIALLELEPPFGQREVQQARRALAKRWHPDLAPAGRQIEHQRHLQAINEAADRLEQLADESRGKQVTVNAVRVNAAAAQQARAEAGRKAYEAEQQTRESAKHDPFGSRVPDHSVVHRYARCVSYPEWGVGNVTGVYFTETGGDASTAHHQQWARVSFELGIRTVPAGTLQFVDFSTPDPAAERVQRFMTAAQHALAEGDMVTAATRLVYARDAEPENLTVLRLLTVAQLQSGQVLQAGRTVRDWIRLERHQPAPYRFAARVYEEQGALVQAEESALAVTELTPMDASAWERLGRLRLARHSRQGAFDALQRARAIAPSVDGLLDLALTAQLMADIGTEVDACQQATEVAAGQPSEARAWIRLAHALARTDRRDDAITACNRALALEPRAADVASLRSRLLANQPRALQVAS